MRRQAPVPRLTSSARSKLDARHLRLVRAIAKDHSVTRAAQTLNLSQSALSHQLLNLEGDLDVALFHRVGKTMVATPAGQKLIEHADRILADLARAEAALRTEHEDGRTPLRLTTSCYTHYGWLAKAFGQFGAIHPKVDARVIFEETRRELAALQADDVDMIVTTRPPRGTAFSRQELFSDVTVAVMAATHPLAVRRRNQALQWVELCNETILIYDVPPEEEIGLRKAIGLKRTDSRVGPLIVWRVQLTEAIVELAAAGQGVGIVGSRQIQHYLADRRLAVVPLAPGGRRVYWGVWRKGNPRRLPFADLVKAVQATCGRVP